MIFSKSKEAVVFLFLFFTIAPECVTKVETDSPCILHNGTRLNDSYYLRIKNIKQ